VPLPAAVEVLRGTAGRDVDSSEMTSDTPQVALATGSTERSRPAAKPARVPHVGSGRAQLSLVEHALWPLDPVASLRDRLVHGTTYGYRDRKGHLVMANGRVTCPSGLSAADEFTLWGLLALTLSSRSRVRHSRRGAHEAFVSAAIGIPIVAPGRSGSQPIFDRQPGYLLEVAQIGGQQRGTVCQRNRGDLEVRCRNPDPLAAQLLEFLRSRLVKTDHLPAKNLNIAFGRS